MGKPCAVNDCEAEAEAKRKGLCNRHYLRQWKNGTTNLLRVVSRYTDDPETGDRRRQCIHCGHVLSLDAFSRKGSGHQAGCKPCRNERHASAQSRERKSAANKSWRAKHRPRLVAKARAYYREQRDALQQEWLAAYGARCQCCGEDEAKFLTVEHLDGGGREHRERVGTGIALLKDLKRLGWPQDRFALLCFNCNSGKSRNGGVCPHDEHRALLLASSNKRRSSG